MSDSGRATEPAVEARVWLRPATLMLGITLLGFGLRVFRLGEQSLWNDEAFSVLLAQREVSAIIAGTARGDIHPPLHYIVLHAWGLAGPEFWLRFPAAMFGTLTVPLTGVFGARLLGREAGIGAALLTAVAPFHVYFGQEARMYSQLGVFSLLAGYIFLRLRPEDSAALPAEVKGTSRRPLTAAAFAISGALVVYTHAVGWLLIASMGLWWLARVRGRFWRDRMTLEGFLGLGALYLPWTGTLIEQTQRVQGAFWTPLPTVVTPFVSFAVFFFGPFLPPPAAAAGIAGVLMAFGLTLAAWRHQAAGSNGRPGLAFALAWLIVPLALALGLSQVRPVYLDRTLIGASYGLFVLLAWGALHVQPRWVAWTLVIAVALFDMLGLARWYTDPGAGKPPLRAVAFAIAQGWQDGDTIVHTSDGSYVPFQVYLPDHSQALLEGDPEVAANTILAQAALWTIGAAPVPADQAVARNERAWLVVFPDHSVQFQFAAAEDFGRGRTLLQSQTFDGISLYLYHLP